MLFGSSLIEKIPLAALRRDDVVLSVGHFDFTSFKRDRENSKDGCRCSYRRDRGDRSDELSRGRLCGVILSALGFAWKSSQRIDAVRVLGTANDGTEEAIYFLYGPLFFGSVQSFFEKINVRRESAKNVVLDFSALESLGLSGLVATR